MISINYFVVKKRFFFPYECVDELETFNETLLPGRIL